MLEVFQYFWEPEGKRLSILVVLYHVSLYRHKLVIHDSFACVWHVIVESDMSQVIGWEAVGYHYEYSISNIYTVVNELIIHLEFRFNWKLPAKYFYIWLLFCHLSFFCVEEKIITMS